MRFIPGTVLFVLGTIIAICAAAKPAAPGEKFPDSFPIFISGFLAAVAGSEIWSGHRRVERILTASDEDDSAVGNPLGALARLVPLVQQLANDAGQLAAHDIEQRVETLLTEQVAPLVEARQKLLDRLGLREGAEVLVGIATGERLLNRAWSAAADGHLVEARSSISQAGAIFSDVNETARGIK